MNRLSLFITLTQFVGAFFVFFSLGLVIALSEIGAPGGSLLNILMAHPVLLLPVSLLGGLFLVLVLLSLGWYIQMKQKTVI
jgi:hypothetical protein